MAHFAEIDSNNIVTRVLVVANEQEHRGQDFLANDLGLGGNWIQTSYNANFRKHYAGIGYSYDASLDAFIPPKCHDSATLNTETCLWDCPDASHVIIQGEATDV
jgi:hypothetical protein